MHVGLRVLAGVAAVGLLLMLAADKKPLPALNARQLQPAEGTVEISANSLSIVPGRQMNYLRFADGVRIKSGEYEIRAEVVELDVASSGLVDTSTMKLPKLTEPPERMIADPSSAVRKMSSDLRGPTARLETSAVKRIAASGNVAIQGPSILLTTATIYSVDGGQAWSTGGKAQLTLDDKAKGQRGSFTAELMSFDGKQQTLLARGGLTGEIQQGREKPVGIRAGELHADLKGGVVEIRGGLSIRTGTMELSTVGSPAKAAPARINLNTRKVSLDGPFTLRDTSTGLNLGGSQLNTSMDASAVNVKGAVELTDKQRGLSLKAQSLEADLDPLKLVVHGNVHLVYGKNVYDSQQAVITQEGEKYIIEIVGPQRGKIDIEGLQMGGEKTQD